MDAAIDMSMAAMDDVEPPEVPVDTGPDAAWRARRQHAFGASEIAALFIALGMRHAEDFPGFVRDEAKIIRFGKQRVSRIFLRKAGLKKPLASTPAMELGSERESELLRQWTERVRRGRCGREAQMILPETVQYSSVVPREFYPLTAHGLKRLAVTPDAWARDKLGDLVAIEAKCSFKPYADKYRAAAPHHVLQLHAQMLVLGAESGIAVEGERWCNSYWDVPVVNGGEPRLDRGPQHEPGGPIVTWPVPRDERVIAEIERAIPLGWERVQELKEAA